MDIDHPVPVPLDHGRRDHYKKSCQHDQIRAVLIHRLEKLLIENLTALIILRGNAPVRDPVFLRSLERISVTVVADHSCDLRIRDRPVLHPVDDRLQICAAA